jgi:hypothetical protein
MTSLGKGEVSIADWVTGGNTFGCRFHVAHSWIPGALICLAEIWPITKYVAFSQIFPNQIYVPNKNQKVALPVQGFSMFP